MPGETSHDELHGPRVAADPSTDDARARLAMRWPSGVRWWRAVRASLLDDAEVEQQQGASGRGAAKNVSVRARMAWRAAPLLVLGACVGLGEPDAPVLESAAPDETRAVLAAAAPAETPPSSPTISPPGDPFAPLLVTAPEVLAGLESRGLALADVLGAQGPETTLLYETSERYRAFVGLVALDDSLARWRDPNAVVGLRGTHRLFDPAWLRSPASRFELAAVVNRIDRQHTTPGSCGEMRLIYRLAYGRGESTSRLPMTLNVVFAQRGPDCGAVARRWLALEHTSDIAGALLVDGGPIEGPLEPVRFEVNFQSGRWPAGVRPTLGGHAEYVLRVFTLEGGQVRVSPLENTPTQRMSGETRAAFRSWLVANAGAIDDGTALLPDDFLAERSVSVHPRGLARFANRAFSQLIPDPARTFSAIDFSALDQTRHADWALAAARPDDVQGLSLLAQHRGVPRPR